MLILMIMGVKGWAGGNGIVVFKFMNVNNYCIIFCIGCFILYLLVFMYFCFVFNQFDVLLKLLYPYEFSFV